MLEKCKEFNVVTRHLFIVYTSAYDSISSNELYQAIETFILPSKLIGYLSSQSEVPRLGVRIQSDLSESIHTGKGLCQGKALACLLYNIALEKVIRDIKIQTTGVIFYKSVQILTYTNNSIIRRTLAVVMEAFSSLERKQEDGLSNKGEENEAYVYWSNKYYPVT